ncbi:MAG: AMP-binding protein, partial [Planctomycetota bacterium]
MPISGPPLEKPVRFKSLLEVGLETKPDEPALVSAEMSWTWAELEAATDRYAANLLGLGLQPGDRVASLMPNRTALILHYIACLKASIPESEEDR